MANSEESHQGYEPEKGLIERVREWTDVFPWLRLGRTLRVVASPILFLLVCCCFAIWFYVNSNWVLVASEQVTDESWIQRPSILGTVAYSLQSIRLIPMVRVDQVNSWRVALSLVWTVFCWSPVALLLCRQGAVLTAGRDLQDSVPTLMKSFRLMPNTLLCVAVPVGCILLFGVAMFVVAWFGAFVEGWALFEIPLSLLVAVLALPCGILGFGALAAVPLGWAAIANEIDADALDSLSRGYEYVYRRFLNLGLYGVLCSALLMVVFRLASGIAWVANAVAAQAVAVGGTDSLLGRVSDVFTYYPLLICITLFWSLVGGVYLLLRKDSGGQDVEDLSQPTPVNKPSLPKLNV